MVDALAVRGDEGRRSLRKASGSGQARDDPEMSEWGNPARQRVTPKGEPAQGTETSKYLQERKSIETPLVVASESGIAQTVPGYWGGVVGPASGSSEVSGTTWNGGAQRVRLPYTKTELGQRVS